MEIQYHFDLIDDLEHYHWHHRKLSPFSEPLDSSTDQQTEMEKKYEPTNHMLFIMVSKWQMM